MLQCICFASFSEPGMLGLGQRPRCTAKKLVRSGWEIEPESCAPTCSIAYLRPEKTTTRCSMPPGLEASLTCMESARSPHRSHRPLALQVRAVPEPVWLMGNVRCSSCLLMQAKMLIAGIEPLQDAARNLLVALRQLSGATVGASPPTQDSTPAKLADDLEVVVHMLRQREEENGRLQHELTLTQAALKGAEATIRKLRAAPSPRPRAATPPPSSTLALCGRRYSEPAETLPTEHSPGLSPALSPRRSSVCRQLLQSPTASILSGLSVSVATAVAPALGVEGGAPPIELPGYEGLAPDASNEPCASGWQADTPVGAAGATSQVQQPQPLRMGQADQGMSLASAIRATLQCGVETPSVVYGSPLHRRIQRVLALQSGLTPCADAAAQVDGAAAQLAAGEAVAAQWGAAVWAEEQRLQAAKPGQAPFSPLRPLELQLQEQTSGDAPARPGLTPVRGSLSGASVAYTELTSSCQTPYAVSTCQLQAWLCANLAYDKSAHPAFLGHVYQPRAPTPITAMTRTLAPPYPTTCSPGAWPGRPGKLLQQPVAVLPPAGALCCP